MTKKITQLLIAFISAILLLGCQSKEMKKAKEFMEASMYDQAISLLKIEIQDNPKNAEANFLLGKCYIETSKNSKVEDYFNRAILLSTDYKEKVGNIYFDKSLELYRNNNFRYADSYYEEGIKYNPTYKDEFAKKLFGYINNYSKTTTETDKPITIYKIINNISPNFKIETSENTFNLAKSFIEKGFIKEGFKYADFSIQYDSKYIKDVSDIYFNHGKKLLTIQNEPNESIYYFDRCMQLNPQRKSEIGNIYYNQAKVFEANNNIKLLIVFAQKSAEINPDYNKWYLEIKEKYKPKIPLDNLVAYFPFNGNLNNEIINSERAYMNGNISYVNDRFGNKNSAGWISGDGSYFKTGFRMGNNWTISFWHNPQYVSDNDQFLLLGDYTANNDMHLKYTHGELLVNFVYSSTNKVSYISTKKWYHIVIISNGVNIKVYQNGKLISTIGERPNFNFNGSSLRIGSRYGEQAARLYIDDLRIYNSSLSLDDVQLLFNE